MVSWLAFNSDDLNSIPTEVTIFCDKIVIEKNENKQKDARDGPLKHSKSREISV